MESLKLSGTKAKTEAAHAEGLLPSSCLPHHMLETNKPHCLGKTRRKRKKVNLGQNFPKNGSELSQQKGKTLENKDTW